MTQNYSTYYKRCCYLFFGLILLLGGAFCNNTVAQTLPRPDHIIILIEENQPNSIVIGSSGAPYINQLASDTDAVVFTKFYAIEHPSQPNYLDMFSGSNQGVLDDNLPANYPFTTPNMAYELLHHGFSFITYSQELPSVGSDAQSGTTGSYARKHNPVTNWVGTGANQVPDTCNQPYENYFPTDYSKLPTVSYVVPDEDSDMHNGSIFSTPSTITVGDYWMHKHLDSLFKWIKNNNALFIYTFDEDDGFSGNNIPTVFYGPMVKGGTCSTHYDLYSLLRTIEDMYDLGEHAGAAASASDINNVWKSYPEGINPVSANSSLKVTPNPASAVLSIDATKLNDASGEIMITDIAGRVISQFTLPESKRIDVNTSAYTPGIYFYHLSQSAGATQTGKFVIAH